MNTLLLKPDIFTSSLRHYLFIRMEDLNNITKELYSKEPPNLRYFLVIIKQRITLLDSGNHILFKRMSYVRSSVGAKH